MSILHRIARPPYDEPIIVVEKDDVVAANDFIQRLIPGIREIISDIQSNPRSRELITETKPLVKILDIIESAGKDGIKFSELLSRTNLLRENLARYLMTLIEQDKIIVVKDNTPTSRGRKPVKIFFKEYYVPRNGYVELDANQLKLLYLR